MAAKREPMVKSEPTEPLVDKSWRSAPRRKQAGVLDLDSLVALFKEHLPDAPDKKAYTHDHWEYVCGAYHSFFVAVAEKTSRLNPKSLGLAAKNFYKLSPAEANLFGTGLGAAFNNAISAGLKAKTGEKLMKSVLAIYNTAANAHAMRVLPGEEVAMGSSSLVKAETGACVKKEEVGSPERSRPLGKALSSPSQVEALYSGLSVRKVKQEPKVFMWCSCGAMHVVSCRQEEEASCRRRPPACFFFENL